MQYRDLILTLHAQKQIRARGLSLDDVYETFKNSTIRKKGEFGGFEFQKEFKDYKITVVAIQNSKNEWVVKSAWRNPPLPGTADARQKENWQKMNKAGFLGKIYLTVKLQLGL